MISPAMSMRPCVCESSGDRFRVQLMNRARRSLKSHSVWRHSSSCLAVNVTLARSSRPYSFRLVLTTTRYTDLDSFARGLGPPPTVEIDEVVERVDRKSTRLNSSH